MKEPRAPLWVLRGRYSYGAQLLSHFLGATVLSQAELGSKLSFALHQALIKSPPP